MASCEHNYKGQDTPWCPYCLIEKEQARIEELEQQVGGLEELLQQWLDAETVRGAEVTVALIEITAAELGGD